MNTFRFFTLASLSLVIAIAIAGCGGGGGGGNDTNNTPPVNTTPNNSFSLGAIELGPVKEASVVIQSLDGYILANATTDENGFFSVDENLLKSAIENYNSQLKFVKVISTGGIDTDPDDDGVIVAADQLTVNGKISGIVPVVSLFKQNLYRINFISTALLDILGGTNDISDQKISYIIRRLGIPDINNDDIIDINDLIYYSIKDNDSNAETIIRNGYLEFIHSGNMDSQQLFIDDLKYEVGFSEPKIQKDTNYYSVNLSKTSTSNTLYYGISTDNKPPNFQEYYGEDILVNFNSALYFQECSDSYGCYKMQKLFFYESNYYADFDYEPLDDGYAILLNITKSLNESRVKYDSTVDIINGINGELDTLTNEISSLVEKVNSI